MMNYVDWFLTVNPTVKNMFSTTHLFTIFFFSALSFSFFLPSFLFLIFFLCLVRLSLQVYGFVLTWVASFWNIFFFFQILEWAFLAISYYLRSVSLPSSHLCSFPLSCFQSPISFLLLFFFLLFWTYNTLTSASGMLALQPCATTPSSESLFLLPSMFKDCALSRFPIFVLLYLKKGMCVHARIYLCICVCVYMGVHASVYTMIGNNHGPTRLCLYQHCSLPFVLLCTCC